jgi:protein SCO1/2
MMRRSALSRRSVLSSALGVAVLSLRQQVRAEESPEILLGHRAPGRVSPPVAMPHLPLILDDGHKTDLASLMTGKLTALQFVLTGCSSICPILGTIFARVQDELGDDAEAPFQLVSFSLDPFGDTPESFAKWLAGFGAGPRWRGAIPQTEQGRIISLLDGWGLSSGTSTAFHTETILLIDRSAKLVFRSPDLPDPPVVASLMRQLASPV